MWTCIVTVITFTALCWERRSDNKGNIMLYSAKHVTCKTGFSSAEYAANCTNKLSSNPNPVFSRGQIHDSNINQMANQISKYKSGVSLSISLTDRAFSS